MEKVETIIVEVKENIDVDNNVNIACIEYIIANNCLRQSRYRGSPANISILSTDYRSESYEQLCKRCSIPTECIVDGYSQWYSVKDSRDDMVHISKDARLKNGDGDGDTCELFRLMDLLIRKSKVKHGSTDPSSSNESIIVIDSMSSLFEYMGSSEVTSFLALRDYLSEIENRKTDGPITLIMSIRSEEVKNKLEMESLKRLTDTQVRIYQSCNGNGSIRDTVHLDVSRRRSSGRVNFEYITSKFDNINRKLTNDVVQNGRKKGKQRQVMNDDVEGEVKEDGSDEFELAQRGLTFRVTLSSKEREMRAAAGLPYLHQDEDLADSALELHPKSLQLGPDDDEEDDGDDDDGDDDDDDDIVEDDEGEVFSEDV